ncbi:zinc finger protein 700 [Drosophila mojavensis]|uniref:Uncharacterized protein, isoform A n=2 Tax=mojavensis species complex TaxID=198037 RepID=B4KVR4_DROMO|nr:zinc finger protein 700 [Drosophila mojavensis]XP_017862525.1 PREDICTED: zinc finger protein 700-like [Drosophila arizonae]XP_032587015.1 zinc finger protein 700 [Drosophila mojavensis]EDW18438.1 uncharacterized protein Dmoj_GI13236, isoform A [Drosophila mojavensis]
MNEGSEYSIHSICRICLNHLRNDPAYDLFLVPGLAKKLCVCTSLSVEQHDGFPKNLCSTCYTRLNDLHGFQKQCVDSAQKFQEMVANNYFTPVIADINQIDNVDILQVPPPDGEMDEDRINFDPLLNTKIEIIENEEDVFKMLEDVDKDVEEVEKAKESSSESEAENDDDDVDFEANSSESDDAMPLSRLRSSTRATKSKAKKKADDDDDDSSSSDSDNDDDDDDDDDDKPKTKPKRKRIPAAERHLHRLIDCHICHQKFKKAIRYEEHMKHHNDLLPFQCTVETCKKGFTTAGGLRLHMDHAHSEFSEVHACTFEGCDKTFPRSVLLTFHMKKVHKVAKAETRNHPCTECEKVFRCPTALKKHMYKHTGEELPFACEICGKRFHIHSVLRDHLLRHAGVKNHVCPYCGVGKTTRQEWNKHILTHTREKQFQCRQCDHSSHNKQALSNHVKVVHMKIKNFACQYCGKTFGKSHACKIHERLHTGENCCECKICGKIFLFEKRLTKHLQIHEKREIPPPTAAGNPTVEGDAQTTPTMNQEMAEPVDIKPVPIVPPKPKNSHRVERVDISQLAGTSVNPIPSVSVPSWSPQVNFTKKEGQHICPGCGRGFNHIGNMKLHYKIIHEKVKDFACRYCPKRFAKAQYLRNHEYIHTGEKPFECKICGKHFRQEQVLKTHLKVHDKPPKPPKAKKPPKPSVSKAKGLKVELNKRQPKIFEEFQDPAAERAAATAALLAQQMEENEAKRKAEEEQRKIQEAACEQLNRLQKQVQSEKGSYDSYYGQKAEAEGTSLDALKLDHV